MIVVCRYFELSANRRDVWAGKDMAGVGRMRAEWNLALLQVTLSSGSASAGTQHS